MKHEALEILKWLADMGDDIALLETPVDRFEESRLAKEAASKPSAKHSEKYAGGVQTKTGTSIRERAAAMREQGRVQRPEQKPVLPDDSIVQTAKELAASANSLADLKTAMTGFEGCNLRLTAKHMVFADGNPDAEIMLVGEAPGRDEDMQGLPFVGRSGQLLDRMLAAIGLDRDSVYISNVIPWRPPGNRTPTPAEVEICRPFIERHMQLVKPKLVVMVGGSSAKMMLQTTEGILSLRGKWRQIEIDGKQVDAIATLHPAYLLRQPSQKRLAWNDLLMIKEKLKDL